MMFSNHSRVNPIVSSPNPLRGLGNRDNALRTATDLGVYQGGTARFRGSGALERRGDKVDIFKVTIRAGASASGGTDIFNIQRGSVRISSYADLGQGPQLVTRGVARKGVTRVPTSGFDPVPQRFTVYVRLDRPTQNTQYSWQTRFRA